MDTVITNIGQLVTPTERTGTGEPTWYEIQVERDTQLHIHNGRLRREEMGASHAGCKRIDACGGVILPGLVDPYWVMPRLPSWIGSIREGLLPHRDLLGWTQRLLHRAVRSGTTSVEIKCPHDDGFDGLSVLGHLEHQQQPRVTGSLLVTLPGADESGQPSVSQLISQVIPEVRRRRLATFFDVGWGEDDSADEGLTVLRAAGGAGLRPKLRMSAGRGNADWISLAQSLSVTAIEGASRLPATVVRQLAESGVVPVYLPCRNSGAASGSIDVRALIDRGLPIAIGSGRGDAGSTASSMWAVWAMAMERMHLSLSEVIVTCTINNAAAMDLSHEIGSLESGKCADLVLFDLVDYRELDPSFGPPPVSMVMINGEVVYRA